MPVESVTPLKLVEFRLCCQENNKAVTNAFISGVSFPQLFPL